MERRGMLMKKDERMDKLKKEMDLWEGVVE